MHEFTRILDDLDIYPERCPATSWKGPIDVLAMELESGDANKECPNFSNTTSYIDSDEEESIASAKDRPAHEASPRPNAAAPETLDKGSLLSELDEAKASIPRLRALRRSIAARCHPDRFVGSGANQLSAQLLAEMNARIDEAIARLSKGVLRRAR